MMRDAEISRDGVYRYVLHRAWLVNVHLEPVAEGVEDAQYTAVRSMMFVMLNPSTANADIDDPTIRRCIGFAKRERCSWLRVVNLFGLRATNPNALYRLAGDPVGSQNNLHIAAQARIADIIVMAWGSHGARFASRVRAVEALLQPHRDTWRCLGLTHQHQPRHPLYVRATEPLIPYVGQGTGSADISTGFRPDVVVFGGNVAHLTPEGFALSWAESRARVPRTPVPIPEAERPARKIIL